MKHGHNPEPLLALAKQLRGLADTINMELKSVNRWSAELPVIEQQIIARQWTVQPDDAPGVASLAADRDKVNHAKVFCTGCQRRIDDAVTMAIELGKHRTYDLVVEALDPYAPAELDLYIFQFGDKSHHTLLKIGRTERPEYVSAECVRIADWLERFVSHVQPAMTPVPEGMRRKSPEEMLLKRRDELSNPNTKRHVVEI